MKSGEPYALLDTLEMIWFIREDFKIYFFLGKTLIFSWEIALELKYSKQVKIFFNYTFKSILLTRILY